MPIDAVGKVGGRSIDLIDAFSHTNDSDALVLLMKDLTDGVSHQKHSNALMLFMEAVF